MRGDCRSGVERFRAVLRAATLRAAPGSGTPADWLRALPHAHRQSLANPIVRVLLPALRQRPLPLHAGRFQLLQRLLNRCAYRHIGGHGSTQMGRHRPDDIMRIGQSIAGFVANDRQLRSNRLSKVEPAIADAIRRKTWEDDQSRPTASCAWITTLAMQQQLAMHVDGGRLLPSVARRGELQCDQCRPRCFMRRTHRLSYASRQSQSSLPGRPARPPCRPLPRRGRGA
ncbi:hypothetical protein FICKIIDM_04318 [Xanthomonas citri pv. punicae]|nr:hypothetical protein FICKIIDM_04318 [Xanthomonas citri pv. punicae]